MGQKTSEVGLSVDFGILIFFRSDTYVWFLHLNFARKGTRGGLVCQKIEEEKKKKKKKKEDPVAR